MDISLLWCDREQRILYLRLAGAWEMDAARGVIDAYQQQVRAAPQPIDLIAEAVDGSAMHPPFWVLPLAINGILSAPKNIGHIVLVPNRPAFAALADVGLRLLGDRYKGRIHTATTLPQARQLIAQLHQR